MKHIFIGIVLAVVFFGALRRDEPPQWTNATSCKMYPDDGEVAQPEVAPSNEIQPIWWAFCIGLAGGSLATLIVTKSVRDMFRASSANQTWPMNPEGE